jgi:hypothetical protein
MQLPKKSPEVAPGGGSAFSLPCRHLRSKEMYYQTYGQADDEFSSGIYWCGKTQENFGPDGEPCGQGECAAGRPCYLQ